MSPLQFEILTAERRVYADEVDMVVAPGQLGELGILPNHAPLLSPLQPGELRIKKGGEEIDIAVSGGFVEMFQNKLTVLADAAERADEIDVERAEKAMARAQERIKSGGSDADLAVALAAIRRSQLRMKVAERRRRRGGGGAPSPQA